MKPLYRTIIILAAITAISYLSVDIVYTMVNAKFSAVKKEEITVARTSATGISTKRSLETYSVISSRNLFGSTDKAVVDEKPINVDELEPTKLQLALLGTVSGGGELDAAVIEEKGKRQQGLYRVGDAIDKATLKQIMRGKVILRVDGKDEILVMEEEKTGKGNKTGSAQVSQRPGQRITLKKSDIDTAMKDVGAMLSEVRIRPYFSGGKQDGFMVSRIARGSIFQGMGLRNGDVIQGVNGEPLGSAKDVLEMYKNLETGAEMKLNIKRRGRNETLEYVFTE